MNSAWIAVVGTLGGVGLTAAAGLLTAMLTGRQRQETVERQFHHEEIQKIREERRAIFVEYLAAYDTAMGRAYRVMNDSHVSAVTDSVHKGQPFETVAEEEMAGVNRAYLTITITASDETRQAADDCTGSLWRIGNAAMSEDRGAFDREVENAREPRRILRAAMRKELNVELPNLFLCPSRKYSTPHA